MVACNVGLPFLLPLLLVAPLLPPADTSSNSQAHCASPLGEQEIFSASHPQVRNVNEKADRDGKSREWATWRQESTQHFENLLFFPNIAKIRSYIYKYALFTTFESYKWHFIFVSWCTFQLSFVSVPIHFKVCPLFSIVATKFMLNEPSINQQTDFQYKSRF